MKVGAKDQVVIPQVLRKEYGISPKDKVVFKDEKEGLMVKKSKVNAVSVFRQIAKKANLHGKLDVHSHEKQLDEKWLKAKHK